MSTKRTNSWVLLGIGGLFLAFAFACFVGAASAAMSAHHDVFPVKGKQRHAHVTVGDRWEVAGPPFVFGLFWIAIGGGMFYGGVRTGRGAARDRRLRASGIRGRGLVRSYKESSFEVNGDTRFDLVLEVEIPGREPYIVKQGDYVPHPWAVRDGADLPVFVDPKNANDVMVDWFTLQTD